MGIKPETDTLYFADNPDERDLALKLDEGFDITHTKRYKGFSFWLAEPKQHMRERFGFQHEILVIYSPHPVTDARVLTTTEAVVQMPEFKYRVEKVLSILIHNGNSDETTTLLSSQTDRVVVPIHVTELCDPQRGNLFLRAQISRAIGTINLFDMSSPITSERYFFGRDSLVQALISRVVSQSENSGLFGLRKTGKTSVLFAVQRRLRESKVLCEYFDCQNPGVHAARWWQLLENIAIRCSTAVQKRAKAPAIIHASAQGSYTQSNAGLLFSDDMRSILAHGDLDHILLMLDEVEYITHGLSGALGQHWDEDFVPLWQTIRATHQELAGQFSFIVAGVNPTCVVKSHFGATPNPIFQLAAPQFLEPLGVANVREMVRSIGRYAGLRFDESVYGYLRETYGGHPYLIRIACSEIWQASDVTNAEKVTSVGVNDFARRQAELKARLSQPIKDILLSLVWWYPEEYDLLRILAEGAAGAGFVSEYMRSQPESLIQFARYGIIKEDGSGFAIADLQDFLNEHGEAYKNEISPFMRGDMPPELLPEVPDLKLLGQLFERRTEVEVKLRKAIMYYLNVKFTFDSAKISQALIKALPIRNDRKNPEALFVGRSPQEVLNEIYTADLKAIVLFHWDIFGSLFDGKKTWFEMNMDTLNKARRVDAHAKPVTYDEAVEFNNSYSWLLTRLNKVP